jgi:hypothetical protein
MACANNQANLLPAKQVAKVRNQPARNKRRFDCLLHLKGSTFHLLYCGLPSTLLLSLLLIARPAIARERRVLHGHVPANLERLTPTDNLDGSNRLNLAIGLPIRNKPALSGLIVELYNPASPNYHHYLTPQEFAARFGPREQDYETLVEFANANGFSVTHRHPNRLLLDVNASVTDLQKAFHLNMKVYPHPTEARKFYAPDAEPSLDLAAPVVFIGGLNNFMLPHPMNLKTQPNADPNTGSAPNGGYMGNDFRNAYAPGVSLTGAGQTVALVQFDGFYQSDITGYEALAGLPQVSLQTVLLDGYDGTPSSSIGNVEVSLDIETIISMAPGISKIMLYEGGPDGIPEDILSQIANDNVAKQISSSWTWAAYDPNSEAIFLQFAAQGQTYFNATGDHDAFSGPIDLAPVDDPYVVQVGGTALTMSGLGEGYISEAVWNRGGGVGTSGGVSTTYSIPVWQLGLDMSANRGSTTMRNVPDVAMVADGVFVKCGNGSSGSFGGTSCAAPLWAGFTALMNQQAVGAGRPTVGFLNPVIYRIGANSTYTSCFHDVTIGNNTSSNSPSQFYATVGYDLCTGWGSPNGSNLINAIAGPPVLAPLLVADSFMLVTETCPNGSIDPGETVAVSVALRNLGLASTSNLVATLQATEGVVAPGGPQSYGSLNGGGEPVTRIFTFVANGICGGTNIAVFQLQDGASNLGILTFSFLLGQRTSVPVLSQNFDGVATPSLPAGWTVSWTGAGAAWATTSALSDTAPNSAFAPDPDAPSDNSLISAGFLVAGSSAQLTFHHSFYTETLYDGGALEISIGAGAFTDILAAGGSFLTNGYTQTISTCCGNPLGGRGAWSGSSGGFITTSATLPASAAGQPVRLRWRFCSDNEVGAIGWYIDSISVVDGVACCTSVPPLIESIARLNNSVLITWSSISNRDYRLQYRTNFSDIWTDVPGDVMASGPTTSKSDVIGLRTQRFYRVMLVQ